MAKKKEVKIMPLDWEKLEKEHRKISILVDNPLPERAGQGKESYVGYVADVRDGFLTLHTPDNSRLDGICIRFEMILSVWIYKENL